jgi:putative phosphoesterase
VRVAALYDIHGMADALEAVLADVERLGVDAIVVGGDAVGGPQPLETLTRLRALGDRVSWVRGNADRALRDGPTAVSPSAADALRFTASRLGASDRMFLASLPDKQVLDVAGLGAVLFCHATPRSDLELITEATPEVHLRRVTTGIGEPVVVAGHTHIQFERRINGLRWINAGSVGFPFEGEVAAFWALLGPDVEFRRTPFDVDRAENAILGTGWPPAEAFVRENLRQAVRPAEMIPLFERIAEERGERGIHRGFG